MTAPTVLRAADHARMAWANRGGVTYEVATHPPGSDLATFDWRVSLADVDAGGPFSAFPGIDRILLVVEGSGMELVVDGRVAALGPLDALRFDGDAVTSCSLLGGPTRDLNVMTRRGCCHAELEVMTLACGQTLAAPDAATVLAVVLTGSPVVEELDLAPRDVVVVDRPLAVRGATTLALVTISPDGHRPFGPAVARPAAD